MIWEQKIDSVTMITQIGVGRITQLWIAWEIGGRCQMYSKATVQNEKETLPQFPR